MNVLVLMCDHYRSDGFGALGNPMAHTPNLDRLLDESVRFTNAFCQAPVCAPTRHSLATGQYTCTHGVLSNAHMPYPGMTTIGHALQPLGYRRFQQGHMHWTDRSMDDGYEEWIHHGRWREAMPEEVVRRYEWEAQGVTRRTTGGPSPRRYTEYSGHFVAQAAIRQMEEAVERDAPFLCWTSFSEPHPPWYPPVEYYARFDPACIALPAQRPPNTPRPHPLIELQQREWAHLTEVEIRQIHAGYWGLTALADSYCGLVLDALDRLGIRDETAVIFTSDHGEQLYEHRLFTKFCMREASVHVPLLVRVPGCRPGKRDDLVEHVDVFPTICDLVGADVPDTVGGASLLPLVEGRPAPAGWRDAVFSEIADVRTVKDIQMVRTAKAKLNVYDGVAGEYYDLARDPQEFHNRIDDPDARPAIEELRERLEGWQARHCVRDRPARRVVR